MSLLIIVRKFNMNPLDFDLDIHKSAFERMNVSELQAAIIDCFGVLEHEDLLCKGAIKRLLNQFVADYESLDEYMSNNYTNLNIECIDINLSNPNNLDQHFIKFSLMNREGEKYTLDLNFEAKKLRSLRKAIVSQCITLKLSKVPMLLVLVYLFGKDKPLKLLSPLFNRVHDAYFMISDISLNNLSKHEVLNLFSQYQLLLQDNLHPIWLALAD